MAIGAILSKGVLIKGSIVAAGGSGLGVAWWQVFDNVRPKELKEEKGRGFVLSSFSSSNEDLDDIPYLSFGDSEKYRNMFKDGDCIKKYLPTKIDDISEKKVVNKTNKVFTVDAHGFSGMKLKNEVDHRNNVGFFGTEGCLSVNIKYDNDEKEENRGMIGRMELVFWNEPVKLEDVNGYGMVLSSIIFNLGGQFKFVNKLSFLKQDKDIWFSNKRNEAKWNVLSSAIWIDDTYSKNKGKNIKFKFGEDKDVLFFTPSEKNKNKKKLERPQNYKKLARWFLKKKGDKDVNKLLGHWNISVNKKSFDLWTDLDDLKNKSNFVSKLYYENQQWHKDDRFKYGFGNFDRYNPEEKAGYKEYPNNGFNRMSYYGVWVDVLEECVKGKKSNYKNVCL